MGCITLYLLLLSPALVNSATPDGNPPYSTPQTLEECMASMPPTNVSRWQNNTQALTITAEWLFGRYTCYNKETCYGDHGDGATESVVLQLIPIEVQQGVKIRFEPSQKMGKVFVLRPYRVNQEDFVKCSFDRGTPILDTGVTQPFDVDPTYLQPGHNYFIAETDVPEFKCEFGLRLDVLVKTHVCSHDNGHSLCSLKGHCHSRRKEEQFACDCCRGFAGQYCEDVDGCVSSPCQNGATCVDVPNDPTGTLFTCSCAPGYNGTVCENRLENMCDAHPCLNNATCTGTKTDFSCECTPEFRGERCELSKNYCDSNPCVHGLCVERPLRDSYQCYCVPGHGGHHCEHEYNECQSDPCKNNGKCIDKVNGFHCQCTRGYTGKDCSVKVDLCMPNPCNAGVRCVDFGDDIACICPEGTSGKHCEININECASSPCENGGTCVDKLPGYKCSCPPLTTGLHCDVTLDGFVKADPNSESHPFGNSVVQQMGSLNLVIGTLGAALFIVLVIVVVMYCRMHKTHQGILGRLREMYHLRANRKIHPHFDFPMDTVSGPYLAPDAVYEMSAADYMDSPLNVPLVNSLKPKRV